MKRCEVHILSQVTSLKTPVFIKTQDKTLYLDTLWNSSLRNRYNQTHAIARPLGHGIVPRQALFPVSFFIHSLCIYEACACVVGQMVSPLPALTEFMGLKS